MNDLTKNILVFIVIIVVLLSVVQGLSGVSGGQPQATDYSVFLDQTEYAAGDDWRKVGEVALVTAESGHFSVRVGDEVVWERKRDGGVLSAEEIKWLITSYTNDSVADYQMSAMAMAIFLNGLNGEELAAWTEAMLHSGKTLHWPPDPRPAPRRVAGTGPGRASGTGVRAPCPDRRAPRSSPPDLPD